LLLGWAVCARWRQIRLRFAGNGKQKTVANEDPPRGIDFADVRTGLYHRDAPLDTSLNWAIALSAVDCEREHFYHDRLDLLPTDASQAARFMTRFATRHHISTPAAWAARISWLQEGGNSREIALLREFLVTLQSTRAIDPLANWLSAFSSTYGLLQATRALQFRQLLERPDRWQSMRGLAYDVSRMVLYYRAGVRLGYIDETEASKRIEQIGHAIAMHYTNWQSFEIDLLLTTELINDDTSSAQAAALRLRADRHAPWHILSWPVVLKPHAMAPGSTSVH